MMIGYQGLEEILSHERFASYLHWAQEDRERAVRLYLFNIQLSGAFYVSLNFLEIALRNRIHILLADFFKEKCWFKNIEDFLTFKQKKQLEDAEQQVKTRAGGVIVGDIVAKLPFGFWTGMFGRQQDELWRRALHKISVKKTQENSRRQKWSKRLQHIRSIRNRIAHYEPIIGKDNLRDIHEDLICMIGWISPVAAEVCRAIDEFDSIFLEYEAFIAEQAI